MTTLVLDSDILSPSDLQEVVAAVKYFVSLIKPATVVTTTPTIGSDVVHITEKLRKIGASGYHISVNGIPTAECSPKASGRLYGHYTAPLTTRPLIIKGKTIIKSVQVHGALYTSGLITVVCHEIAEMLADGNIATFTAPDSKGREFLLEPCDWVFGTYLVHTINGKVCVFPNVALDAFSILGAPRPYDLIGAVSAPFALTPKGYAFYKGINGVLTKV